MLERLLQFSITRRWAVLVGTIAVAALGVYKGETYEMVPAAQARAPRAASAAPSAPLVPAALRPAAPPAAGRSPAPSRAGAVVPRLVLRRQFPRRPPWSPAAARAAALLFDSSSPQSHRLRRRCTRVSAEHVRRDVRLDLFHVPSSVSVCRSSAQRERTHLSFALTKRRGHPL